MTQITFLSKAPQLVSNDEIIAAIRIEVAIINHCRANYHFGMDTERSARLERTEHAAQDRHDLLLEMLK